MSDERDRRENQIRAAFENTPPLDSSCLRDSSEGDEPFLLEAEFQHVPDWRQVDVAFIDQAPDGFGSALSFFSNKAFRYYLPAYLLADLRDELQQANPLLHLWHGLVDGQLDIPVNERRYGSWTWLEAMADQFQNFSPAEVTAIVAYLGYKAKHDELGLDRPMIEQALRNYWLTLRQ
ncbi:MAG TPA: DUF6714 family protein [Dissulfurispiraceae bacterium]|nr:DUF6714 family protein [Dissulfurispiraceae bacterium]